MSPDTEQALMLLKINWSELARNTSDTYNTLTRQVTITTMINIKTYLIHTNYLQLFTQIFQALIQSLYSHFYTFVS